MNYMMINFVERDFRKNESNFKETCGSFSVIQEALKIGLKQLGLYTDDFNEATHVGFADSLDISTSYPGKKNFRIVFYDTINTLTDYHKQQLNSGVQLISVNQHTADLFAKIGKKVSVIGPALDTDYWFYGNNHDKDRFHFLSSNFSNHRSSIDLLIQAFWLAFGKSKNVILTIKNTSDSEILARKIQEYQNKGCNINYINKRMTFSEIRDMFHKAHLVSNLFRFSAHGLSIGESQSCGTLSLSGNYNPSNLINGDGILLNPNKMVEINKEMPYLVNEWGLTNCISGLSHLETPFMYDYSIEEFSCKLKEIYDNWDTYKLIDIRKPIVENWDIKKSAAKLVEALETTF